MLRIKKRRSERGAVMVLVALLMVAMLIVVAIVLDGGQGYADRRRMQNAADAAAYLGARVLNQVRFQAATTDLATAVRAAAADNGADPSLVTCDVTDLAGARLAACTPNSGWSARADAVGVAVTARMVRKTLFGRLAGVTQLTPAATAAASIQKLVGARSPWMICGNKLLAGGFDLINPVTKGLRPDAVLAGLYGQGGTALTDSRGIPIAGKPTGTCGLGSSWNGLIDPVSEPVQVGKYAIADRGKQVGRYQYDDVLAGVGGCPRNFLDGEVTVCLALIPVFDAVDTASGSARIAAWAVWRIRYDQNSTVKYWGQFVTAGVASAGVTSTEALAGGSTVVVKLAA